MILYAHKLVSKRVRLLAFRANSYSKVFGITLEICLPITQNQICENKCFCDRNSAKDSTLTLEEFWCHLFAWQNSDRKKLKNNKQSAGKWNRGCRYAALFCYLSTFLVRIFVKGADGSKFLVEAVCFFRSEFFLKTLLFWISNYSSKSS